jgi:hypothetical protein
MQRMWTIGRDPYTDRMDYIASMNNSLGYALWLLRNSWASEVNDRVKTLRIIVAELRSYRQPFAFGWDLCDGHWRVRLSCTAFVKEKDSRSVRDGPVAHGCSTTTTGSADFRTIFPKALSRKPASSWRSFNPSSPSRMSSCRSLQDLHRGELRVWES